jgi:predicted transcriptional regulator
MQLIWERANPVTVKEIHGVLAARRAVAYTTVMTTMLRLSEKGILHREQTENHHNAAYRYTAVLRRQDVLLARVEQVLASPDEVERQYVAAAMSVGAVSLPIRTRSDSPAAPAPCYPPRVRRISSLNCTAHRASFCGHRCPSRGR